MGFKLGKEECEDKRVIRDMQKGWDQWITVPIGAGKLELGNWRE